MKKKNLAFTLAEVLIVIGIIGVVAALTLPNLNHATGDKEKVTKVKKIYSTLTEAVDRAQVIYGPFDTWFNDLSTDAKKNERVAKRVTEFMKVSKDCGTNSGCFSNSTYIDSEGNEISDNYFEDLQNQKVYMISLSDGMSIAFGGDFLDTTNTYKIRVDIDGPNKGKNQYANDIFDFSILLNESDNTKPNQLVPSLLPYTWTGNYEQGATYSGSYATAWVIENGNLDYLKCPDELNWETKTSCE